LNLRLKAVNLFLLPSIRRRKLRQLVDTTATAFGVEPPDLRGLSFGGALQVYSVFTRNEALRWNVQSDKRTLIKNRLFECGCQMGAELRRMLRVRTRQDVVDAARILYRLLSIDFRGEEGDGFSIKQCSFSTFYTDDVCKIISSLDEGLIAGLSDGAELRFLNMMTEGHDRCSGSITFKGTTDETSNRGGHRCWWCNRG